MKTDPRVFHLLFACINPNRPEPSAFSKEFRENFPWSTLLQLAGKNRLLGLLYQFLEASGLKEWVPSNIRESLERAYYQSLAWGVQCQMVADIVERELNRRQIPYVFLRGLEWANGLYGNAALRPMLDVDVLIDPSFLTQAKAVLQRAGFIRSESDAYHHHHQSFRFRGILVEVHTQVTFEPVLSMFPEFRFSGSLDELRSLCGRPLAAVHYWIKKNPPALWMADYLRLPAYSGPFQSPGLPALLRYTDDCLRRHWKENPNMLFEANRSRWFWLHIIASHGFWLFWEKTGEAGPFIRRVLAWQLSRALLRVRTRFSWLGFRQE